MKKMRRGGFKKGERKLPKEYEVEAAHKGDCLVHPAKKSVARKVYQLRHGKLRSSKICVCHTCDTPRCILDTHHFLGSQKDNMHDASMKGRMVGARGRCMSPETVAKISASLMGHSVSKHARRAVSKAQKGVSESKETRRKLSVAQKGVPKTAAHLANMIKGQRRRRLKEKRAKRSLCSIN
jgi:hypothetical protein